MSERSGIPEELLYCVKLNYHKILTMVNMNAPVKRISDLYEYYVYEVLSQEAIAAMPTSTSTTTTTNDPDAPNAPNAPNAAGKEEEKTPADTDVDEHGVYTLMKCRCKWKSMRGAYYNAEIRGRNKDGTYVVDYSDGDEDTSVEWERLSLVPWEKDTPVVGGGGYHHSSYHPSEMEKGFHTALDNDRITVECVHRVAKTNTYFNNTPVKELVQYPLVLSMQKGIQGDALHSLVWAQLERYVQPESEWGRHNLPYVLRVDQSYQASNTKKTPVEDVSGPAVPFTAKDVLVVDWSPEGVKTGFDKFAFEKREDHASYPSRTTNSNNKHNALSLSKCFHEMAKEEQLSENDKWHCSECRKAGREPFRQAFKKMTVYRTGEVLVLHLKRFIFEAGFSASFVHREKIE
jgi:hypothetical protein